MILWLLLQAATSAPAEDAPVDPFVDLRGTIVEAIRDCGMKNGVIVACSPDKGYSERERRIQKLKKPKPVDSGTGITIEVTGGTQPADTRPN